MATGFECQFAEKVSKGIQAECPICLLVLREPYQATCCGKSFCKECIHRIKGDQACPTCNDKDFTLFPNKGLQQSLYDFQVYCTHKSKGCEWTGELREVDNHLNSDPPADKALQGCPYTLIKCPLSCIGCEKGVCRKDVKSHVNDKLLGHVMIQSTWINALEKQLQKYHSTNTQLKTQFEESKEHLNKRVMELDTKVSELGMKKKKLENEVEALKLKRAEVVSKVPPNQPISNQQPITHVTGTYKPIGAEFTMTNFEGYRRDDDEWYSSHFYTHPNGYKLCLHVHANGHGSGRGTHLSVFVKIMRGEFDDQLKWPFRGNIIVKLVNQEKDRGHIVETIHFDESNSADATSRVIKGIYADSAPGYGQFLPHSDLQPNFLKNNCIKLCIKRVELY